MSATITPPKDYAAVAVVGLSTWLLYLYHGSVTQHYRAAAKISHPQCYAEVKQMEGDTKAKKFTCAQRAQGNFTEQLPPFVVALGWTGLRFPLSSAGLGIAWIMIRVIYIKMYTSDVPGKRVPWFVASNAALATMILGGIYSSWELYTGRW